MVRVLTQQRNGILTFFSLHSSYSVNFSHAWRHSHSLQSDVHGSSFSIEDNIVL